MSYTLLPDITVQRRTLTQHWHKLNDTWMLETEDDSLRPLDIEAIPENPGARPVEEREPDPNTTVEVSGPGED
jgi:hypothetical protein